MSNPDEIDRFNEFQFKEQVLHAILQEAAPERKENGKVVINTGIQTGTWPSSEVTLPLLPFTIEVNPDRKISDHTFKFKIERSVLRGASSIGSSIHPGDNEVNDVRTFPHEFTFKPIAENTDMKISSFLPGVTTPLSSLTPDHMLHYGGDMIVMEFATSQSNTDLIHILQGKVEKYRLPLQEAVRQYQYITQSYFKVHLCVFVVSESRMAMTHKLPQELIDELIYRYRLAYSIQGHAYHQLGLERTLIEGSSDSAKLKALFERIPVSDLGGEFSLRNYQNVMAEPTDEDERNMQKKIMQQAKKNVKELVEDFANNYKPGLKEKNPNVNICRDKFIKYLQDTTDQNAERGLRNDMKSIVQIPFLSLKKLSTYDFNQQIVNMPFPPYIEGNTTLNLIRDVIDKIILNEVYIPEEMEMFPEEISQDININLNEISALEEHIQMHPELFSRESIAQIQNRSSYHRVIVQLGEREKIDLAKVGINGKKLSNNYEVSDVRDEKSRFFCPSTTDTSDLDRILSNEQLINTLFEFANHLNVTDEKVRNLIYLAESYHNSPPNLLNASKNYYEDVLSCPIGLFSSLISDIGVELSISLRQNCKPGEFIVKKLKNFNLWLVIKPTKSSSHIFFSLFTYDVNLTTIGLLGSMTKAFKHFNQTGELIYTDFVSLNMSKLVNWVLCESRLMASYGFWLNSMGVPAIIDTDELRSQYRTGILDARRMTLITLLVNLADKAEIEEHMSMLRYITLEGMCSRPYYPKPYKMFEKFSKQLRSRLTIWVIRKLANYALHVSDGNIHLELESQTEIATNTRDIKVWMGFMNPYLGTLISSPQLMINLFYLGYLKNKDEYPENNTITKLYEKILVIEDELTDSNASNIGIKDKDWGSEDKHIYNITLIKLATNSVIYTLHRKNPGFKTELANNILNGLADTSLDPTFTTLKASSTFDSSMFTLESLMSNYSRVKVIEATSKVIKDPQHKLVDILPDVCEEMFNRKYLSIDIFQKNQHGGLREIYVLGLFDRIVQYVIEYVSRKICDLFPGETMTHPNNKKQIPESHSVRAKKRFDGSYLTFGLSADASKWSQNHYAHKFSVFLLRFLPRYLHGFIWNSLHLWKDKRILLNPKLIEILDNPRITGFYSEPIQKLYDCYHGRIQLNWYKKGNSYIQVKTGMMQGILHYTSSLLHTILNEYSKTIILLATDTQKMAHQKPEVDMIQSSDDSAMIISIPIMSEENKSHIPYFISAIAIQIKEIIGRESSILNSVKTTANTLFFHEFNSEFKFGSNHYRPDIKFMIALPLISEQEATISRQEEWSTLLTQYIENGGSTWPVHIGQLSQALLHYRLMGSSVNKAFDTFSDIINFTCDPSQGFFFMDPILSAGLLGFKYNLWNMCNESNLSRLYKNYLFSHTSDDSDRMEVTQSGNISRTIKLIYGDRKKWKKVIDRMGLSDDWKEQINSNPKVLYVGVRSHQDLLNMIGYKMNTSGVAESIAKGNVISRTIASSVYLLTFKCLTRLKEWQLEESSTSKKSSMFDLILQAAKKIRTCTGLNETEIMTLFPFHDDFCKVKMILNHLQGVVMRPTYKDYRRRVTDIDIASSLKVSRIPLKDIVSKMWFPTESNDRLSPKTANILFQEYQLILNWLTIDPIRTVELCPFEDAVSLYNWVNTITPKSRVVRLLGTPIISHQGKSNLITAMTLNFQTHHRLEMPDTSSAFNERVNLQHFLYMTSRSPFTNEIAEKAMEELIGLESLQLTINPALKRNRENSLAIIQKLYKGGSLVEIASLIEENRLGIIGGFTTRASPKKKMGANGIVRVTYEGVGIWEGTIHGVGVLIKTNSININTTDQNYTGRVGYIQVSNMSELLYIVDDLKNLCSELGVQYDHQDYLRLRQGQAYGLTKKGLSTQHGIPISCTDRPPSFTLDDIVNLEVKFSREVIRIVAIMRARYQKPVTLISYRIYESDYVENLELRDSQFFDNRPERFRDSFRAWINNKSLTVSDARELVNRAADIYELGINTRTPEVQKSYTIVREVLVSSIVRKGICYSGSNWRYSFAARAVEPEEDDSDDNESLYDNIVEGGGEEALFAELGEVSSDDSYPADSSTIDWNLEEMLESESGNVEALLDMINAKNSGFSYSDSYLYRRHRLFETYIDNQLQIYAMQNISSCFEQCKISQGTVSLRNIIAVYSGVGPSNVAYEEEQNILGSGHAHFM